MILSSGGGVNFIDEGRWMGIVQAFFLILEVVHRDEFEDILSRDLWNIKLNERLKLSSFLYNKV